MLKKLLIGACVVSSFLFAASALAGHLSTQRSSGKYPSSIAVLGEDGATGLGSNPAHQYRDAPENSWATGTNPAVKSIYSRILAVNPAVRGHNVNLAQDDAPIQDLGSQVKRAVALKPTPELVLVQIGSNGFACDGQNESHYADFRAGLIAALDTLTKGLPKARVFVVSEWGSEASYAKYLRGLDLGHRLMHASKSPCEEVQSSSGLVVPAHVANIARISAGFDAQKAAACKQFPQCRFDRGAASRIVLTSGDMDVREQPHSIQSQAKLAAAEWAAMAGFVH